MIALKSMNTLTKFKDIAKGDVNRLSEIDNQTWNIITYPTQCEGSLWQCEAVTFSGKTDIIQMDGNSTVEVISKIML